MDLFPEELLADILGRLPPRPLAVCRSVCKDLRAVIDGRGLLLALAHRVPRGLGGIFINRDRQDSPYFFARRRVDAELISFLPQLGVREEASLVDQCNGLLLFQGWTTPTTLCELRVCNPTTRRWEQLPPPPEDDGGKAAAYLVFDPTVSLHYDVFLFPMVPPKPKMPIPRRMRRPPKSGNFSDFVTFQETKDLPSSRAQFDREVHIKGSVEWPPSPCVAQVFSSRTGQWEERAYVREDNVAVTISDVWSDPWSSACRAPRCNAVCWREALYLHCRGGFIMRFSLLEQKYKVIKTPRLDNVFMPPRLAIGDFLGEGAYQNKDFLRRFQGHQERLDSLQPSMHLGKSEHGIYYIALRWHQVQVWVLHEASESRAMPEWELKYKADIRPSFLQHYKCDDRKENKTSWVLNNHGQIGSEDSREDCGWDSGDDSGINVEEEYGVYRDGRNCHIMSGMDFLGCHPSKEIVFLGNHFDGFAYYLGSSKLQYLGTFEPAGHDHFVITVPHESFIYTPCMDDLLSALD